jgi:hypothetical protein
MVFTVFLAAIFIKRISIGEGAGVGGKEQGLILR